MFVNPDYIFYVLCATQQQKANSEINIAFGKVCSGHMTSGMLSKNISETVEAPFAKEKAYRFMNSIKDTPAH